MTVRLRSVLDTIPVYRPGESPDECGPRNAIKLSSNESPWEPPAAVVRAIEKSALSVNRYPDYYEQDLCRELAGVLGVDASCVCVDNGSGTLLQDVVRIVCDQGDNVVYCTPTFAAYEIDIKLAGAIPKTVPLDETYSYAPQAMIDAVDDKTRMVLVCNPNNPTGTYLTADVLDAFVDVLPDECLVVIDEAYHDFERVEPQDSSLGLVVAHDNVLLLRTFSKAFGLAGIRVGYCIGSSYLIDAINKTVAEFSVSSPAQAAARACLSPETLTEIEARVATLVDTRERFQKGLKNAGIDFIPSSSNFVMLPRPNAMETFELLKRDGIITRPFSAPEGIRITIGTEEQMARVAQCLGFELPEAE